MIPHPDFIERGMCLKRLAGAKDRIAQFGGKPVTAVTITKSR